MVKLTNKTVNTFFIILFVFLNIIYTALRLDVYSPFGLAMFGSLLVVDIIYLIYTINNNLKELFSVIALFICLLFHKVNAESSVLILGLVLSTYIYFKAIQRIPLKAKAIAITLVIFYVTTVLFSIDDLIRSLLSSSLDASFQGIFENPNTMGAFSACAMIATFLFIKNKKIKLALLFIFILCIVGCKSRNLLLFSILTIFFYFLIRQYKPQVAILCFCIFVVGALYYLIIIEPQSLSGGMEILGKEGGSAGRSSQILLTISTFPLTLFGVGYDVPSDFVINKTGYAIHNFYINTVYSMGLVFMLFYVIFIIRLYLNLRSYKAKAFLLASHIYFLFEPGMALSPHMINCLPISLILLKLNQEYYENRSLYF